jgi:hypothetical protein
MQFGRVKVQRGEMTSRRGVILLLFLFLGRDYLDQLTDAAVGNGLPVFSNGSSLTTQDCASDNSCTVAPVAMMSATVTSSTSPIVSITSLRVKGVIRALPVARRFAAVTASHSAWDRMVPSNLTRHTGGRN